MSEVFSILMLQLLQTRPTSVLWTRHSSDQSLVSKGFSTPTQEPSPLCLFQISGSLEIHRRTRRILCKTVQDEAGRVSCLFRCGCLLDTSAAGAKQCCIQSVMVCMPAQSSPGLVTSWCMVNTNPHQQQAVWGLLTASHTCSKLVLRLMLYLTALAWAVHAIVQHTHMCQIGL